MLSVLLDRKLSSSPIEVKILVPTNIKPIGPSLVCEDFSNLEARQIVDFGFEKKK